MILSQRKNSQIRPITVEKNFTPNAFASCLIKVGNTHVLCSATVDESLPHFLRGKGSGWLTAEYSMLPTSTNSRVKREVNAGKVSGRTQEIQRLIGRSLRAVLDMGLLGERQIIIDCDVINADGGTRCAAITGGYIALSLAIDKLMSMGLLKRNPLMRKVAAISCGIIDGNVVADLDFSQDSTAQVDANFVIDGDMNLIEVQATSERAVFSEKQLFEMLDYAKGAMPLLFAL